MPGPPNAAYSLLVRLAVDGRAGVTGVLVALAAQDAPVTHLHVDGSDATVVFDARSEAHAQAARQAVEQVPGARVLESLDRTFSMHAGGKLSVDARMPLRTRDDLSMAYTPGVARVCLEIARDPVRVHDLTTKGNTVAVVTDGTAVLGLGDIGPEAALPVMEGKAVLFKEFAGIDAFPICLRARSADEVVEAVERLSPGFGGINLEDIAAPRCFEVEERLRASLSIPVFHDDQHGTAVVVLAALRNSLRLTGRKLEELTVVIAGVGAAGVAIARILLSAGVGQVIGVDRQGAVHEGRAELTSVKRWFAEHTNRNRLSGTLDTVLRGADVFVGVSGPGLVRRDELATMAPDPIVFALANPDPEISPAEAEGIAAVMATGRSDYPNQINNVLCFPGMFRGALDAGATSITEGMNQAAASAIAAAVSDADLRPDHVVPSVFEPRVVELVAAAVGEAARADGVVRSP